MRQKIHFRHSNSVSYHRVPILLFESAAEQTEMEVVLVVLRCKNDVCVGVVFVNFTMLSIFYVVCLAFHRWCHAVVIIVSRFTVGY